ncbi:MAG: hypothetical protein AAF266_15160 [Planctomycetota bacterium]
MRKATLLVVLVGTLVGVSGCSMYDALFGMLGDHYTDEGGTAFDKRRHYESRVESLTP